jgi:hypothetical protein
MLRKVAVATVIALALVPNVASAEGAFIAGLAPDHRPDGAPVISTVTHDDAWLKAALTGVEPPAPESLHWLADQGNWFNPFIHPGMIGPYDLRGWHQPAGGTSGN